MSRNTEGTSHKGSDHDIVCLFVHRTDRYFSMQSMGTAIKKTYPEVADSGGVAGDGDGAGDSVGTRNVPEIEFCAWECRHAFNLLNDSNLTLLDAFYSPVIYRAFDPAEFAMLSGGGGGGGGGGATPLHTPHEEGLKLPHWVVAVQELISRVYDRDKLAWATWSQVSSASSCNILP
jgi:hypothetical protein